MDVLASVSEATTQPMTRSICCALRKCHGTLVSRLVASASMRPLSQMRCVETCRVIRACPSLSFPFYIVGATCSFIGKKLIGQNVFFAKYSSITAARRPSRISLHRSAMVSRLSCNHCSGLAVLYSGHASK